jgi:hypothetical protein
LSIGAFLPHYGFAVKTRLAHPPRSGFPGGSGKTFKHWAAARSFARFRAITSRLSLLT